MFTLAYVNSLSTPDITKPYYIVEGCGDEQVNGIYQKDTTTNFFTNPNGFILEDYMSTVDHPSLVGYAIGIWDNNWEMAMWWYKCYPLANDGNGKWDVESSDANPQPPTSVTKVD
jgi:hypothetical protein